MRRLVVAALVLAAGGVLTGPAASSPPTPQLHCKYGAKYVTRMIHGHKRRAKVCKPRPKTKPAADLSITVQPFLERITAGNQLVYEVKLENLGPTTAQDVQVSVSFPAGAQTDASFYVIGSTGPDNPSLGCEGSSEEENSPFVWRCRMSELEVVDRNPDAVSPSAELRFVVEPDVAGPLNIEVNTQAGTQTRDPRPDNNHLTSPIDVLPGPASADLALALDAAPTPATLTDDLTVTARVTNNGATEATSVQLTVLLPLGTQLIAQLEPISDDETCPSYSDSPVTVTLCWPVIQPGETVERHITLAPVGSPPPVLETDAVVSAHTPDPHLADNRTHASTPLQPFAPLPGVDLVAHLEHPVTYEGYVVFPFGIANKGTDAENLGHGILSLSGPIGQISLAFLGPIAQPPGPIGPCPSVPGALDCFVSLPSGARANGFVYAESSGSGTVHATVTAKPHGTDANPADNTATASIDVTARRARR